MVTIGNSDTPGTILTIESARSIGTGVEAPGDVVLVGQADLQNGSASANDMVQVTRPKQAADEFGARSDSQLTKAVQDALVEGAYPVFAIAAERKSVTAYDLSSESGNTGTLPDAPHVEDASAVTFTINSTTKDTTLYYDDDPANGTPDTDEVLFNPVTGKFHADESLGSAGDEADYEHFDYTAALDEVKNAQIGDNEYLRERVDLVGVTNENDNVVNDLDTTISEMENEGWLAIGVAGAGDPHIADTSTYNNNFDTSRMQLVYPSRTGDNRTAIGAYLGHRSTLGIESSPIFNIVQELKSLQFSVSESQKTNLVNARVVPLEERGGGAKIIEDVTTVTDSNDAESAWRQGFSRLVTDYVAEMADEKAQPYIGELNTSGARASLRENVSAELRELMESNQLQDYSIVVEEDTSTSVLMDIGIETTGPIKNIYTSVLAGDVQNGQGGDN